MSDSLGRQVSDKGAEEGGTEHALDNCQVLVWACGVQ